MQSNLINEMWADLKYFRGLDSINNSLITEQAKLLEIRNKRIAQRDSVIQIDSQIIDQQTKQLTSLNRQKKIGSSLFLGSLALNLILITWIIIH